MSIKVGTPEPSTIVPGNAASVRETSATLFVVDGTHAKKVVVSVKGESLGTLYMDPTLKPGTRIVTEGRSLLADGDAIVATLAAPKSSTTPAREGAKP